MKDHNNNIPITEIIRLVSTILLRIPCPSAMSPKDLSLECFYYQTFSVDPPPADDVTIQLLQQTDVARTNLMESLSKSTSTTASYQATIVAAKGYICCLKQLLASTTINSQCHVGSGETTTAPWDEHLPLQLQSNNETSTVTFTNTTLQEALNSELEMAIACLSIATGCLGYEYCDRGNYDSAAKQFQVAASIWKYYNTYLHNNSIPIKVQPPPNEEEKEKEFLISTAIAGAMVTLHLAYAQQMFVASTLKGITNNSKEQTTSSLLFGPKNTLLAKLTLGIVEQMNQAENEILLFVQKKEEDETIHNQQSQWIDEKNLQQTLKGQKQLHSMLSTYFLAHAMWEDNHEYGVAIAMMQEVEEGLVSIQNITFDSSSSNSLQYKVNSIIWRGDIATWKAHVVTTLQSWQLHIENIYSEDPIQPKLPSTKRLQSGIMLMKEPVPYNNILEDPIVSPLSIPNNLNSAESKSLGYNTSTIEITASPPNTPQEIKREAKLRMKLKSFRMAFGHTGGKTLMHGILHIKIIRAINLEILTGIQGVIRPFLPRFFINHSAMGLYVTVKAGNHRLAKTSISKRGDLNPVWNETFYIPVAHYIKDLIISLKVRLLLGRILLGTAVIPVGELVRFDEVTQTQVRVAIHKIGKLTAGGELEFVVEFIPNDFPFKVSCDLAVPDVYFQSRNGNKVQMYVNADDGVGMAPEVRYGGPSNNEKVWRPPRLWRDIYDAICDAKYFIYITGWALDTTQSLLRGEEKEEALAKGRYSPFIGELLKQKAEEGVTVNLLFWDDMTSNFNFFSPSKGVLGTHDEFSKVFFQNTKVTFHLAPMLGGEENVLTEKFTKSLLFTHHQKIIVLDAASTNDAVVYEHFGAREPLAFVGGIDLTDGRWDNRKHPLFSTLDTDHKDDFYNGCMPSASPDVGPRQPWHDIHSSVRGPAVLDVIANFQERWYKQASDSIDQLLDLKKLGLADPPILFSTEAWCSQVLRSIDERTAVFHKIHKAKYRNGSEATLKIGFCSAGKEKLSEAKANLEEAWRSLRRHSEQSRSSRTLSGDDFLFTKNLCKKKGRYVDTSMHTGYVHLIRNARHMLYIETQYFLGSSHLWTRQSGTRCGNLIPTEITLKICEKIHRGERFAAYILVPLWPEGVPESSAVQAMLYWQKLTMESMYKRIADTLKRKGRSSESPKDYLNFYALAKREIIPDINVVNPQSPLVSTSSLANKTGRHQIYVHSKLLIVDDAVAIIGSANINQRSMDGARDSEIGVASYQPAYLPTDTSVPHGDVHGFRLHCWATITNKMEDIFRDPSSILCVRRMNEIAKENWSNFISTQAVQMDSHLIPYPIDVDENGNVVAHSANVEGFFPDTKAPILGTFSFPLPDLLTT